MTMLHYITRIPDNAANGAPLIVLLHGRGSDEHDLMGLAPHLPDDAIIISPRAPFPGAPWGYGPGWAWYQFLRGTTPEPHSFEAGQQKLSAFLAQLPGLLPVKPGPLVLGGFSQGGTSALAHALRHPGDVPLTVNLSGFLADHPTFNATPKSVAGTAIFWGHGTEDPAIPFVHAEAGRAALTAAGADLTAHDYHAGHTITPTELQDLNAWLGARLAQTASRKEQDA
jgi:phospholipase/carboxylesterase